MKLKRLFVLLGCTLFLGAAPLIAQVPQLINYQAQISGTGGAATGTFAIYDDSTAGTKLWEESHMSLTVRENRIQALLGSITPFGSDVFEGSGDRYLQVTVSGETLTPRSRLSSVSYALRAAVADRVAGGGGAGVSSLNTLSGDVTIVGGTNVSVTPEGQNLRIDATGGGGTGGITTINAGTGIAVSDTDGPTTEISLAANGITDMQVADNSLTANSLADNSVGSAELQNQLVLGPNGDLVVNNGSNQNAASIGNGPAGGAVLVKEQPGNYDAVELSTRFANNTRLGGQIHVRGRQGLSSVHIFADGSTDGGRIVMKEPSDNNLIVLTGENGGRVDVFDGVNNNQAVISLNGADNVIYTSGSIGVKTTPGTPPVADLDVVGDVRITGNLSKGSGSFTIDHPLDPQNKLLSHSFVESPDMMNVYNGNVNLDANGEAWIELPEWFSVLNKDFRYQLTAIGGFAPIYIAEKIEGNRFKIAGGNPSLEVSWQVTGIRTDPYAQAHRIQVEQEKSASERGSYLHPDAYGQDKQ